MQYLLTSLQQPAAPSAKDARNDQGGILLCVTTEF